MQLALLILIWLSPAWIDRSTPEPATTDTNATVTVLDDGTPWPPRTRP